MQKTLADLDTQITQLKGSERSLKGDAFGRIDARFERSAQLLRRWVPSSLRSSAPAQPER
jgi:hypothetical protein